MVGRTVQAAEGAFLGALQNALACVSLAVVRGQRPISPRDNYTVTVSETPVVLGQGWFLTSRMQYVIVAGEAGRERGRVRTTRYTYQLTDADQRELMIYQWDPDPASASPIKHPHLHIGRGLAHPDLPPPFRHRVNRLAKAHLPTGHITLPTLLRTIIADLSILPRHADWAARLDGAHEVLRSTFEPEF